MMHDAHSSIPAPISARNGLGTGQTACPTHATLRQRLLPLQIVLALAGAFALLAVAGLSARGLRTSEAIPPVEPGTPPATMIADETRPAPVTPDLAAIRVESHTSAEPLPADLAAKAQPVTADKPPAMAFDKPPATAPDNSDPWLLTLIKRFVSNKPAAKAPDKPAPAARLRIKRRDSHSEEELRKQLASAPEVSLLRAESTRVMEGFAANYKAGKINKFEPTPLLGVRPDLKQLPIRHGADKQISASAAARLTVLSRKLHVYLTIDTPKDAGGRRPEAIRLLEKMRLEMRDDKPEWLQAAAVPVLLQLLGHEDTPVRLMLVELLNEISGKESSAVLARRAVFDLASSVREAALAALVGRPREDYRDVLLRGLNYPWAPAADHAAEALVALEDKEAVPELVNLLQQPEPNTPYSASKNHHVVRELVRINHMANCLMCHPPAVTNRDPVPGIVPEMAVLSTSGGYGGGWSSGSRSPTVRLKPLWIRADVAYLRQDFSILQQPGIALAGLPLPAIQRTDYLVRERPVSKQELKLYQTKSNSAKPSLQRQALLFTLRELTGKDLGSSFDEWRKLTQAAAPDKPAVVQRR